MSMFSKFLNWYFHLPKLVAMPLTIGNIYKKGQFEKRCLDKKHILRSLKNHISCNAHNLKAWSPIVSLLYLGSSPRDAATMSPNRLMRWIVLNINGFGYSCCVISLTCFIVSNHFHVMTIQYWAGAYPRIQSVMSSSHMILLHAFVIEVVNAQV